MSFAARAMSPSAGTFVGPDAVIADVPAPERERALRGQSFLLHHTLAHSPALSLSGVNALGLRMLDERRFDQVACESATIPGREMTRVERLQAALCALKSIETSRAWIRLTRADEVSDHLKEIACRFTGDLSALYGEDIGGRVLKTFVTLFISSPGQVTPYHFDHTWNFLLQIQGSKTVHLFDADDPRVLTAADKERWYMERKPSVELKPEPAGTSYCLQPGDGAHHPVNAPHWVQNGPDISISLSLGLCLRDSIRDARVHQVNYMLRQIGLEPIPPGRFRLRDAMKSAILGAVSKRNPNKFDDVLFSGKRRVDRLLKLGGIRL